ncbi:MAG: 23S rRNA (guanosine(2251)-2'-O)-methyltransferase RlmB [Thermobifida fusca]|uniref:23S rRNA (guanosine(2251)-2'-O)-methyltransferase RlmB n=1 Tax=Thermobifida TaxID=83677 RepID=UPI000CEE0DAE|nr:MULTISPECIES: 23S rRNA (guanosine(2251)-2'-O)-methyltransferase RlmB [Thermobifida]MBO2529879.1 23S rRNA (guanosine(2251)-2'-O)-methyltransferase RlmB [Thermobifida sp.]PPS94011.1 RNA methyltransferase [Thermobifida fusca]PZN61629.1 MAG: 23S rRNA (guanosine(2251)-2'-O)-methyltransferase RlmB [Thermobifida fusca]
MPSKRTKKGPTKGSGGKGRRALAGKKATLPAEKRHWYAEKQRIKAAERAQYLSTRKVRVVEELPGATVRARDGSELLIGRNPVVEALRAKVPAVRLLLSNSLDPDERITEAARLAGQQGIAIAEVARPELDRRCERLGLPKAAHQGLILQVEPYEYATADDLLAEARKGETTPLIVALDGVTDPHNLGAIARSAAAFGAHGLLVPERRAAGVTTAAWKASAGTLARIPVAQVVNLTRTLKQFQEAGFFVSGLDADGDTPLDQWELATEPSVVVVGSEGKGLSRLVRETCDVVVSIPIHGVESLNASVAAGVALYEAVRRRTAAK